MIKGNGHVRQLDKSIPSFTKINLQNNITIHVSKGKNSTVMIRADDNILPYIITQVVNDELIIALRDNVIADSDNDIQVTLQIPTLTSIRHLGSGDIYAHGVDAKHLMIESHGAGDMRIDGDIDLSSMEVSGSGDIQISNAHSDSLVMDVHGEADIELNGNDLALTKLVQTGQGDVNIKGIKTDNMTLVNHGSGGTRLAGDAKSLFMRVSGSADVDTFNLKTQSTEIQLRGSGDVMLSSTNSLIARVFGSGDITYYGSPKNINLDVLGSGRIHPASAAAG